MNEPILIFETDPRSGTPKLKPVNGAAAFWSQKDLCQLEEQLRPRYESLVRDGDGTIEFKGRTLHVNKKDDDTSRQPTLELRLPAKATVPFALSAFGTPKSSTLAVDWTKGFLAGIDRLFASAEFNDILPVEKAMLHLVRDELKSLLENNPSADTLLLVLVSLLMTAEHISRTERPNEPRPYACALSGLERLLSLANRPAQTPWGNLPVAPDPDRAPSWLGRFWNRLTGAP